MERRTLLKTGLIACAAFTNLGREFWSRAFWDGSQPDQGPYGPLGPPDENGIRLPKGFKSRVIARAGEVVAGTTYVWHVFPDGGATYAAPDGGWIYVSNSEVPVIGGVGAVRFEKNGDIADAYRVLAGTSLNCAGGPTPWGTWLSCEEHDQGMVWECDPTGEAIAEPLPPLGTFEHEAAAVDPKLKTVYLTEDKSDGCFYRYLPSDYPNLAAGGELEVLVTKADSVEWVPVPNRNPLPGQSPTRHQVPEAMKFDGGEGCWFDAPSRTVYFTTKGDGRVWAYQEHRRELSVIHDPKLMKKSELAGVDNVVVSKSGDIFVAEDGDNMQLVMIANQAHDDGPLIAPVLQVVDQPSSEIAGPAFDPSGRRLYFSSQRGGFPPTGITYEISGPFRTKRR